MLVTIVEFDPVEPCRRFRHRLERVVGGEHDPIRTDLLDRVEQGRGAEVSAGGEVEVRAQVVPEGVFDVEAAWGDGETVVRAPDVVRQKLAEVAEDDREIGVTVEEAGSHETQRVGAGFDGERPR